MKPAYYWAMPIREWNRLVHALHGNGSVTPWLEGLGPAQLGALDRAAGLFGRLWLWQLEDEGYCESQVVHAAISATGEVESFVLAIPHSASPQSTLEQVSGVEPHDAGADPELVLAVAFIVPDGDQLRRLCDSCPEDITALTFHATASPDPASLFLTAPNIQPLSQRSLVLSFAATLTVARNGTVLSDNFMSVAEGGDAPFAAAAGAGGGNDDEDLDGDSLTDGDAAAAPVLPTAEAWSPGEENEPPAAFGAGTLGGLRRTRLVVNEVAGAGDVNGALTQLARTIEALTVQQRQSFQALDQRCSALESTQAPGRRPGSASSAGSGRGRGGRSSRSGVIPPAAGAAGAAPAAAGAAAAAPTNPGGGAPGATARGDRAAAVRQRMAAPFAAPATSLLLGQPGWAAQVMQGSPGSQLLQAGTAAAAAAAAGSYQSALANARAAIGAAPPSAGFNAAALMAGPAGVPPPPGLGERRRLAPGVRAGDAAAAAQVRGAFPKQYGVGPPPSRQNNGVEVMEASQAEIQLAILRSLERLSEPSQRGRDTGASLDDLLRGLDGGTLGRKDSEFGDGPRSSGSAGMARLNAAIELHPTKWSLHTSEAMQTALGCHITGMPWSAEEYGRRHIRFGRLEEHERMWTIMTHLHGLMLQGKTDLAMARVCQAMKAIETSVASGGRWDLAWLYTGLKDPRPRFIDRGLAHPAEFATNVAYLKEMQTVHTALGGAGAAGPGFGGGGGGGAGSGSGNGKSGAGSGGYGRGFGNATNAEGNISNAREKGGRDDRKRDRGKGGKPAGGSTGSPPAGS